MPRHPQQRPVFFNVLQIAMPVGALTSIAHRISGVLLAASLPLAVYLLDQSLQSEAGYAAVTLWLEHSAVKFILVGLVWALSHHLLAGIRHLLMDIDVGSLLRVARLTAWVVNVVAVLFALWASVLLW